MSPEGSPPQNNQELQRQLTEAGSKIPGVAEAIAVYGSLQPYVHPRAQVPSVVRVATGGNL